LTDGGGAAPSTTPPGFLGFRVRLTEGGGEKGVIGSKAGLANGKGLAMFE